MNEGLGKLNFWLVFISMNITFFPMHFTGLDGMPRRIYTYDSEMGWDFWNLISSIGSFALGFSVLVFIINLIVSSKKGEIASGDPWDARTLEWSISSPPPEYNFAKIPVVHSIDPFWVEKREGTKTVSGGSGEDDEHDIHLPQPSYWPFVASIGLFIGAYGLIYSEAIAGIVVATIGGFITMVAIYAWSFEPVNDPEEV